MRQLEDDGLGGRSKLTNANALLELLQFFLIHDDER